ncbi:MAG: phospholipid carrier-dependent glycosyltransferase [Candidatus Marinimicrobia bacterium]|nr:phospholipid carrier-dependent glycosyltransferase [Candidatus Neomarinimicrobiota bacterium]
MQANKSVYLLLLMIIPVIAYWNSFNVPFLFDDDHAIKNNPGIRDLSQLDKVFRSFPNRPVAQLTFAVNYHFHELNVKGYHEVNLMIHCCNALLVFWLVLQILQRLKEKKAITLKDSDISLIAFFTGLLFAIHPIQTQAVTYIVQRMASLAALFYLLAVNCYLKGRSSLQKSNHAWIWFVLAGISGLLGLFTKQIVFTFPFMILMLEWILYEDIGPFLRKNKKKAMIVGGILLLFLLILPLWYHLDFSNVFRTIPPEQGHTYTLTPYTYFLTQLRVHMTYLRLIFVPLNQHLDYDFPISESLLDWRVLLSGLFLLGLFFSAIRLRKKYPVFSIGILWYFIASAVESSIIPIPNVIFEHRVYLPLVGILLIIVFTLLSKRTPFIEGVLIVIIALSLYLTHQRNEVWKSYGTLWEESYRLSPHKVRPLNNYANNLVKNNEVLEGYLLYDKANKIIDEDLVKNNLYRFYLDIGNLELSQAFLNPTWFKENKINYIIPSFVYHYTRKNHDACDSLINLLNPNDIPPDKFDEMLTMLYHLEEKEKYQTLLAGAIKNNFLTRQEWIKHKLLSTPEDSIIYLAEDIIPEIKDKTLKADFFYNLSRQHLLQGNSEIALWYIMDALDIQKKPEYYHLRATLFSRGGNYLYAAMDYTSAFKLSGDPEFIKRRALCYEQMGYKESAKNEWRYYEILTEKEGEKGELPESALE